MDWVQWIAAVAGGATLLWVAGLYNRLVNSRNACEESWSDIATELARRYDLIPSLVETVKGYAAHEREALEAVVRARNDAAASAGSRAAKAAGERHLEGKVEMLFALAEQYPDLKASENFQRLHEALTNCEDRIQRARRFYNSNVRDLADRLQMFPSNVVAALFGFGEMDYFAPSDGAVEEPVEASFGRD